MARDALTAAVREFTGAILNPYDVAELLHRLTRHAMHILDAQGAGILLVDRADQLQFAAASADPIVAIERFQEEVSEGACHHAYSTNEVVAVADVAAADRWPRYRERVRAQGLRAVIGVPMNAYGRTIGVINVYREQPGPWDRDDVDAAEILAAMGAGYLAHANDLRAQHDLAEQLQVAIDSRDVIGQAKGVLMEREGIDAAAAFDLLRGASQRSNQKLRDVARRVVKGQPLVEAARGES